MEKLKNTARPLPSLESQVNLNDFEGLSTPDAIYRLSGVRVTGLLGSFASLYSFGIDLIEDINKEINESIKNLERVKEKCKTVGNLFKKNEVEKTTKSFEMETPQNTIDFIESIDSENDQAIRLAQIKALFYQP